MIEVKASVPGLESLRHRTVFRWGQNGLHKALRGLSVTQWINLNGHAQGVVKFFFNIFAEIKQYMGSF